MATKVFVLEEPKGHIDMSSAKEYGELSCVWNRHDRRPGVFDPEFRFATIEKLVKMDFDPKKDYFAFVGNMVPNIQAVVAILSMYGRVRALFFDTRDQRYKVSILD